MLVGRVLFLPLLHLLVNGAARSASAIPERPCLAPWYRLIEDADRVLLEHGGTVVTLEGKAVRSLLPRLMPLLDGRRTIAELVDALGGRAAPAVENALAVLAANNLLVDGPLPGPSEDPLTAAASFAAAVTRSPRPALVRETLAAARAVVAGNGANAQSIARELRRTGLTGVETAEFDSEQDCGLLVVAPDRVEVEELQEVNVQALRRGTPWLQVLPYDGRVLVVGPLFVPGTSACHQCFRMRRAACSGYEDDFDRLEAVPACAPPLPSLATLAAGLATVLALRWLATADARLPGRFYSLDPRSVLSLSHHHVLRVPRCPACAIDRAVPSPWHEAA